MPTTRQSSTNCEGANTSEHTNTKKSRLKSSSWWKILTSFFAAFNEMEEILSIQTPVTFDESVAHYEVHAHQPYTASFNNSDETRISIQHQDLCLLPSRSALHICGRLAKTNNTPVANTKLVNNAICHLFEEIRYELNAIEIYKCKNVGLTTLMKGWVSHNPTQSFIIENAGWIDVEERQKIIDDAGYFNVSIPLSLIFGFDASQFDHCNLTNVKLFLNSQ